MNDYDSAVSNGNGFGHVMKLQQHVEPGYSIKP